MSSLKLTVFVYLFVPFYTMPGVVTQRTSHPTITATVIGTEWHTSTLQTPKVFFSCKGGDDLFLKCEAPFPITWSLTGYINPPEVVKIQPAEELSDVGSSLRITCEPVGKAGSEKDEVFVFVRGNSSNPFVTPKSTAVKDSTVIPCPTRDPVLSTAPTLFRRRDDRNEEQVQDPSLKYNPIIGFTSREAFNGVYICRQGPHTLTFTANISGEYSFTPEADIVRAFTEEIIQLECFSRSPRQNVTIVVDNVAQLEGNVTVSPQIQTNGTIVKILWKEQNLSGIRGIARCVETRKKFGRTAMILKEWKFEFVPTPQLYFNNAEREVNCLSDVKPKVVQTVRCINPADCAFMSHCLENATHCNFIRQNQYISNKGASCYVQEIGAAKDCVSVPFSHLNGVVQCSVNGMKKQWEFFESLERRKYTDWQKVPKSELIRLEERKVKDAKENSLFICTAVAYIFADSLYFEVEFKNGSRKILRENGKTVNISNPDVYESKMEELNVVAVLEMQLPPEAAAVHCHAPWWNTTGTMTTSRKIMKRHDANFGTRRIIFITLGVVSLVILTVVLAVMYIFIRKYQKAQQLLRSLSDNEIDEFFKGKPELLTNASVNQMEVVEFLPYDAEYEIPLNDLKFETSESNFLGSGEFSYVVRGKVISKAKPAAIKIAKATANVTLFKSLLSEVKIMIYIGQHENVVALMGVCTEGIRNRSIYIVTEICELGSLDKFLRIVRPTFVDVLNDNQELDMSLLPNACGTAITTIDLISFAGQIANGMKYLSSKLVIHADLAARNVLLTQEKTVKISDFGLSKKLYEKNNYIKTTQSPLPWRWMALESLNSLTFSTASDIWSYGVTLYEIFTLGDAPFPNEVWNAEFIGRLESGMRMGRPKYSTVEIYSKMVTCWENLPSNRPSFEALCVFFHQMCLTLTKMDTSESKSAGN